MSEEDQKFEVFIEGIRKDYKRLSVGGSPALFGLLMSCKNTADARKYIDHNINEFSPEARQEFIDPFMQETEPTDIRSRAHRKLVNLAVDLLPEFGSGDALRAFFELVVKDAQAKYANEHSAEIMAAFEKALPGAVKAEKEKLERLKRIGDSLRELDKL